MNTLKQYKPGEGRKTRHPILGRRVDPNGEPMAYSPDVARMLRDGDLVEVAEPNAVAVAKSPATRKPAAKNVKRKTSTGSTVQ